MNVRGLGNEDVRRVAQLEQLCNPQPWNDASLRTFIEPSVELPHRLGRVAADAEYPVAGYACALFSGEEGEILILGVDPVLRKQGIGRLLLSKICLDLQVLGARTLFLELRTSNRIAWALYRALGFRETGIRKAYYSDSKEDALQMRRDF